MSDRQNATGTGQTAATESRRAATWLGMALLFLAILGVIWYGGQILLLTFAGILLGVVLRAPIGFLVRRTRMPNWLAFTIVVLGIVLLLVGFGFLVGPQLGEQAGQFAERVPEFVGNIQTFLEERTWGRWIVDRIGQMGGGEGQDGSGGGGGSGLLGGLLSGAGNFAQGLFTTIGHLAYVVVLGLCLAINPDLYRAGVVRLFPKGAQQRATEVLDDLGNTLKFWLLGQLALMLITGGATFIGLIILGIPMALALGFFVGLMEFIPFVGPIIGFIPILLVALSQGFTTVLWALGLYIVIQQLEGNVLVPLVQQRAVALPPALTVGAVFLGGALFGPIGAILGTPLIAVVFVLIKVVYVEGVLGQRVNVPGDQDR